MVTGQLRLVEAAYPIILCILFRAFTQALEIDKLVI